MSARVDVPLLVDNDDSGRGLGQRVAVVQHQVRGHLQPAVERGLLRAEGNEHVGY